MYKCKCTFWNEINFPGFKKALSDLYDRSISKYYSENNFKDKNRGLDCLNEIFPLIEYYYASLIRLGYVNEENYSNILRQLKSIDSINLLQSPSIRGVTIGDKVSINPVSKPLGDLNEKEMFRLTVFHELGHIINNAWINDMGAFCDRLFNNAMIRNKLKKYGIVSKNDLVNGFVLLEDVLVEEAAEDALYKSLDMPRPDFYYRKSDDFPGVTYRSNYSMYTVFQEVGLDFFRCFNFINCSQENKVNGALKKCTINAFKPDFIKKIEEEICTDISKMEDFALMLGCLGKIKNANYASFGFGVHSDKKDNSYYYNLFQSLVSGKIIREINEKNQSYSN